jgi:hypothetical protein
MNEEYELDWKRNPETGHWLATDDRAGATYVAARDMKSRGDRPWTISVFVPDGAQQTRTGFDRLSTAKTAALATRCHLCSRILPFATMEQSGGMNGWRCRDHDECLAVSAAKDAEARRVTAEIRGTPWAGVSIRDADDGPELVFRTNSQNSTVVRATEPDLIRLAIVLLERYGSRAQAALDEIRQARKGGPS